MAGDPVRENQSDPNSFGFRKNRSAGQAVHLRKYRTTPDWGQKFIFETDVEKCFDKIKHDTMRDRSVNKPFQSRLEQWLQVGALESGKRVKPMEFGTPQGGVVSPMLCNLALNGMEAHIGGRKLGKVELVRYADDIVVLRPSEGQADAVKRGLEEFLDLRGLKLKRSKTKVSSIKEGVDFLGWTLRRMEENFKSSPDRQYRHVARFPTAKSMERMKMMMREEIVRDHNREEIVKRRNPRIRGWCQYYKSTNDSLTQLAALDAYLYQTMVKWEQKRSLKKGMKRRDDEKGGKWTWVDNEGTQLLRPITLKGSYPRHATVVAWDKQRLMKRNPYVKEQVPREV
jgi:RNA-directed DNA polymerase